MNIDDIYSSGGTFFRASDLIDKPRILTITSVVPEKLPDGKHKLKVSFAEDDKLLLLNKTNAMIIGHGYGNEFETWIGRKIKLRAGKTTFEKRLVDCINVEVGKAQPMPPAGKPSPQYNELNPPPSDMDDEVPF